MTDRELLEAAAKAAGVVGHWERDQAYMQERYYFNVPYDNQNMLTGFAWDPLNDDGEALRLAVKLGIVPRRINGAVFAWADGVRDIEQPCGDDPYAATRRAIVRAAAAIGALP